MSRRAFTANELMMALLLIAIMTGVVATFASSARERARTASCGSNVKEIALALHMYAEDNGGRFPLTARDSEAIMPYVKNQQIFSCMSASEPNPYKAVPKGQGGASGPPGMVEMTPGQPYEEDYLFNPTLHSDDLPSLMLAGDDAPARHRGGWNGARLDGAVAWWPAKDFQKMLGWVTNNAKPKQ
jgi:Tfp pilus assembly protein PilE